MLLAGLAARGHALQPFKAGPDYIDIGYHNHFSVKPSITLDSWLMGEPEVLSAARSSTRCATGILEGVMGLFDGASASSDEGSTMELARLLQWPVVLCVPAAKAGRSLAAALRGFIAEAHPHGIAGVVLNGVSGSSHAEYLREALLPLGVQVLGAIPKSAILEWPERYLGLRSAQAGQLPSVGELAALAALHLDLERFEGLAQMHPKNQEVATSLLSASVCRVAIAQDEAFHFYYANNLDWLRRQGAELVPFSPIHSRSLPANIDGILLGGGFPELHAAAISDNQTLRRELRDALCNGLPCYAECGGLMLLADKLVDVRGDAYPMTGALPGTVEMTQTLQHFGYCIASGRDSQPHRGHEFHHSVWSAEAERGNAWSVTRKRTGSARQEGFRAGGLHASYVHLHFSNSANLVRTHLGFNS
jgi:cobyrinic acid a,c-diamide synthase